MTTSNGRGFNQLLISVLNLGKVCLRKSVLHNCTVDLIIGLFQPWPKTAHAQCMLFCGVFLIVVHVL